MKLAKKGFNKFFLVGLLHGSDDQLRLGSLLLSFLQYFVLVVLRIVSISLKGANADCKLLTRTWWSFSIMEQMILTLKSFGKDVGSQHRLSALCSFDSWLIASRTITTLYF